jgi:hypothetical protein
LEVGVTNDYFRVHASRSVIEALIRTAGRLEPLQSVRARVLEVAYYQAGRADGDPALLLHGFPYDLHS